MNFSFFSLLSFQKEETNIYSSDITPTIELLNKSFTNFQITDTLNNLDSQIESHSKNLQSLYYLYIVKAEYFLKLQRLDELKDIVELIQSTFSKFIDNKFDSLLLMYFTLLTEEENYFQLAKKVSLSKNIDIEYFQGIYYLNQQNPKKAQEIFLCKFPDFASISAKNALIFGHIYRDLIYIDKDKEEHYSKMVSYYNKYIEEYENKDPYELITTNISRSIIPLDNFSKSLSINISEKAIIQEAVNSIESIADELHNFSKSYKFSQVNNLLYFYYALEEHKKFKSFSEKNIPLLNTNNTINYYLHIYKDIDSETIYDVFKRKAEPEILIAYLESLYNQQKTEEMITFVETKTLLSLKNDLIDKLYDLAQAEENINLDQLKKKYEATKSVDLFHAIIYLKTLKYLKKTVQISYLHEIKKLIINNLKFSEAQIISFIKLLFNFRQHIIAYDLVINIRDTYTNLNSAIFHLSSQEKYLKLDQFEWFLKYSDKYIDGNEHYVGNIYSSYYSFYKAYQYYYRYWSKNQCVESAKVILDIVIQMKNLHITFDDEELTKVLAFLTTENIFNEIDITLLGTYNHFKNEDYELAVILFNKTLLTMDLNGLKMESLNKISGLYFNSITVPDETIFEKIYKNLLIIESPLLNMTFTKSTSFCLTDKVPLYQVHWINDIKNNKYYIHSFYKKISLSKSFSEYKFEYKSERELKLFPNYYNHKSLFHFISNKLVYKADNIKLVETNIGEDNQFEEIFKMIKDLGEHEKNIQDNYNEGGFLPLYSFAKSDYQNIPPLMITNLLSVKENLFLSGKNIPLKESKKILSFSSLMLLKYLGHLEPVLELKDVYVQETVLNLVESIIQSFKNDKTKMSMSYKDGQYFKHEQTEKERLGLVKVYEETYTLLLKLITSKRIVKDYEYVIPYKLPSEVILSIGHIDYYAMGYCINKKYQLISEDNSFTTLYEKMGIPTYNISNMMSLLQQALKMDDFMDLAFKLHELSYSETLNSNYLTILNNIINNKSILTISKGKDYKTLKKMVNILNDGNSLESLKLQYKQQYMSEHILGRHELQDSLSAVLNLIEK